MRSIESRHWKLHCKWEMRSIESRNEIDQGYYRGVSNCSDQNQLTGRPPLSDSEIENHVTPIGLVPRETGPGADDEGTRGQAAPGEAGDGAARPLAKPLREGYVAVPCGRPYVAVST